MEPRHSDANREAPTARRRDPSPGRIAPGKPAGKDDTLLARRYRLVKTLVEPSGEVLLDFGCGNGAQTFLFARDFAKIVAIDADQGYLREMRREAVERGLAGTVIAVRADGERLPLPEGGVDFAVSFEVLEHVADDRRAAAELFRAIRPGGMIAVSVPNRWWIFETHGARLPVLPWNRVPFFSWLPKAIHDRWARARIYSKGEIVRLLEAAGFSIRSAVYVTAPMDVVRWPTLRRALRASLFRRDRTNLPSMATAILVIAERRR